MKKRLLFVAVCTGLISLSSCDKINLPWTHHPHTGVDKNKPASIVCSGNHITFGPKLDGADHYPAQLATQLWKEGFSKIVVTEKGYAPYASIGYMTHSVDAEVDPYKISTGENIVIVTEFTDDTRNNHQTADASIQSMKDYCDSLHAHGWKVITSTVPYQNPFYEHYPTPPYPGSDSYVVPSFYDSAGYIAQITEINDSLRAGWNKFSDGFIDLAADGHFKAYDSLYYQPNHMDLTRAGAAIVADLAAKAAKPLLQ